MIIDFTHPRLTGKPCKIHEDFKPFMDKFCDSLELTECKAYIVSSLRNDTNVEGAIVEPAKRSNHLVGYAVDVNFIDDKGIFWNSELLKNPSGKILDFIQLVKGDGLRWGGEFSTPDNIHFDYPLNILDPQKWDAIYSELHSAIS